ncbi:unnamed protein product [Lota lota]
MLASLVTQQPASAQGCLCEGGEAQNHSFTSITACPTCPSVVPLGLHKCCPGARRNVGTGLVYDNCAGRREVVH